ncbi:MAG: hypothetical protein FJ026_08155 [Chloroflexi bacterium]|nr:hypothetical protein [Chloroflexota bacterium]
MISRPFSPEELVAAYLADPLRRPRQELPWAGCDVQVVLKVLRENKVPLLSIGQCADARALLESPPVQAAIRAEAEELAGLRAEYRKVKETLASEGIADAMIKSVGRAPSFPYKSDNLDVLYRMQHVERIKAVLRDLGYVELKNVDEPHKYLFRKFHAGRSISAIHLHAHVGWMVSFLDEEALWQRCRTSEDDPLVTVPAAEDALLTTLAHYFYEDKRIALLDVLKFAHCLRRGVNWDEVYRVATWRGWRDGLNVSLLLCAYQERALYGETLAPLPRLEQAWDELPTWARSRLERRLGQGALSPASFSEEPKGGPPLKGDLQGLQGEHRLQASEIGLHQLPLRISFVFSKIFFYAKLVRDPTRSARRRLRDLAVHTGYGTKLRLHIHSQPAMLVTFSGVDGCGKTTQAEALQSAFETCLIRANRVWSRGGSSSWLGVLTRWSKRHSSLESDQAAQSTSDKVLARQERFQSTWIRWGWSWLTAIELLWQYFWHVRIPLRMGRVVICDRYVYDALADWAAYFGEPRVEPEGPPLKGDLQGLQGEQRLAARVLRWLCPRPHIAYWLDAPADVVQSRSADRLPKSFLEAQGAAYAHFASQFGLRRADGTTDKEDVSDQVVYEVLTSYFGDYHTLINQLFLKNPGQWR